MVGLLTQHALARYDFGAIVKRWSSRNRILTNTSIKKKCDPGITVVNYCTIVCPGCDDVAMIFYKPLSEPLRSIRTQPTCYNPIDHIQIQAIFKDNSESIFKIGREIKKVYFNL